MSRPQIPKLPRGAIADRPGQLTELHLRISAMLNDRQVAIMEQWLTAQAKPRPKWMPRSLWLWIVSKVMQIENRRHQTINRVIDLNQHLTVVDDPTNLYP